MGDEGIYMGEGMVAEMWDSLHTGRSIKCVITFGDNRRQFSTIEEDSYKYGKGQSKNEFPGGVLELAILEWANGFQNIYLSM